MSRTQTQTEVCLCLKLDRYTSEIMLENEILKKQIEQMKIEPSEEGTNITFSQMMLQSAGIITTNNNKTLNINTGTVRDMVVAAHVAMCESEFNQINVKCYENQFEREWENVFGSAFSPHHEFQLCFTKKRGR